jgi:hypothetical protein
VEHLTLKHDFIHRRKNKYALHWLHWQQKVG